MPSMMNLCEASHRHAKTQAAFESFLWVRVRMTKKNDLNTTRTPDVHELTLFDWVLSKTTPDNSKK